jgi:cardiolipin synthase
MHQDGRESASALFATMSQAAERLDICTYILGDDAFGREAMQCMMARARAGVQVRLLVDGVGAAQMPRRCFRQLHLGGVETKVFSPLFARKTQGPRNLRNHRKMVISDGTQLWAGGRNIAAEYFIGLEGAKPWRDLTFDLQGPVATAAASQFEADWVAAGGRPAARAATPGTAASIPQSAGGRAQFLPSGPDQAEDTVHALLIDACFHVRERVLAVTPYFVPDASLETAMRLAARRGVKIDLCIPAVSNHRLADFARNRALRALTEAGARIHLLPYMIHAKAVVFDQSLALSGSVNLDSRSLLLNYECAVVFYGATEIDWLAQWIQALIPEASPYDNRAPALWRDIGEGLLLTVAYQL